MIAITISKSSRLSVCLNFSSQTFGKHAESVLALMEPEAPVGAGLAHLRASPTQTGHQPGRPSRNKEDTFCSLYATAQKAGGILSIKDGQGPAPGPVRPAGSEDWPGQGLLLTRVVPPTAAHPAHRPASSAACHAHHSSLPTAPITTCHTHYAHHSPPPALSAHRPSLQPPLTQPIATLPRPPQLPPTATHPTHHSAPPTALPGPSQLLPSGPAHHYSPRLPHTTPASTCGAHAHRCSPLAPTTTHTAHH